MSLALLVHVFSLPDQESDILREPWWRLQFGAKDAPCPTSCPCLFAGQSWEMLCFLKEKNHKFMPIVLSQIKDYRVFNICIFPFTLKIMVPNE